MPPSRVIALVEPFWTGHPETQLKLFAKILLGHELTRVLVLCKHPEVIQDWINRLPAAEASRCFTAEYAFCEERGKHPSSRVASWALAQEAILDAERRFGFSVDKVFITWLDILICNYPDQVAALMPRPWVGLYLFPSHLRKRTPWSWVFRSREMVLDENFFKNPFCHGIALLDEGVQRPLSRIAPRAGVHVLPDVADTTLPPAPTALASALLEKAAGRPIVGLLGVLGRRKGTLPFLRAIKHVDPAQCFFLLAGRLKQEEHKTYGGEAAELDTLLASTQKGGNTLVHLDHIESEQAFNSLLSSCTMIYLAYDGHPHSSGLLCKAAYFHKLVIGPDKGCVGERVRRFKLGLTIPAGSDSGTVQAIRKLSAPHFRNRLRAEACFRDYQAHYAHERLKPALIRFLEEIP